MIAEKDTILNYLREQKPYLSSEYHVSTIGLFGSFARGDATESSDIDILVEFDSVEHMHDRKESLRARIEREFGRHVDLCRMKYIRPYAREMILKEAIYA